MRKLSRAFIGAACIVAAAVTVLGVGLLVATNSVGDDRPPLRGVVTPVPGGQNAAICASGSIEQRVECLTREVARLKRRIEEGEAGIMNLGGR